MGQSGPQLAKTARVYRNQFIVLILHRMVMLAPSVKPPLRTRIGWLAKADDICIAKVLQENIFADLDKDTDPGQESMQEELREIQKELSRPRDLERFVCEVRAGIMGMSWISYPPCLPGKMELRPHKDLIQWWDYLMEQIQLSDPARAKIDACALKILEAIRA